MTASNSAALKGRGNFQHRNIDEFFCTSQLPLVFGRLVSEPPRDHCTSPDRRLVRDPVAQVDSILTKETLTQSLARLFRMHGQTYQQSMFSVICERRDQK